jgi:hypothetical protein
MEEREESQREEGKGCSELQIRTLLIFMVYTLVHIEIKEQLFTRQEDGKIKNITLHVVK